MSVHIIRTILSRASYKKYDMANKPVAYTEVV